MKQKKAQMEIVGLVVIIILLAVLAVIFLTLTLREKPSTSSILRTSTKADNLLNSIIRTNTQNNQKMLDFITERYTKNDFVSLKQEISKIMAKTISSKQYSLKILINQEKPIEIGSCNTGIISTKTINHQDNIIKFTLTIC